MNTVCLPAYQLLMFSEVIAELGLSPHILIHKEPYVDRSIVMGPKFDAKYVVPDHCVEAECIMMNMATDFGDIEIDTELGLLTCMSLEDNLKYVIPIEHIYQVRTANDDLIFELSKEEFRFITVPPKLRLVK